MLDIRVINLDRSRDRMQAFEAANGHLRQQISRIAALDGKGVDRAPLVARGTIAADLGYDDGALGNALSHLALWDFVVAQNRSLTICEDDAIFSHGFAPAAEAVIAALPQDWHIVLWGWNFDSILWFDMIPGVSICLGQFEQDRMRSAIGAFQSAPLTPRPFKLLQAFGTVCYSVSPAGARALRQFCVPLRNMDVVIPGLGRTVPNLDIGIMLNNVFPRINAFVSFPPLVITCNDHGISTIQGASRPPGS